MPHESIAANLPKSFPADHHRFIHGSDARILMSDDEAALVRLWREKRGDVGPGNFAVQLGAVKLRRGATDNTASLAPIPDQATVDRTVQAAHASFIAALAETRPRTIPISPRAADLEDRAEHLDRVLTALSFYLSVIFQDTAANVPGGLDLRQIEALLCDLASEVSGTLHNAAAAVEEMVP